MATVSLIAAVADNGVIGRDGGLPWRLKDDFAYFVRRTMGKPVVMGRKTYESIPPAFRPLKGRRNIVVTRDPAWRAEGVEVAGNVQDALDLAAGVEEVMVAGGADVYAQVLPVAHKLYLTEVHVAVEGDSVFPHIDKNEWQEISREAHIEGEWRYDWVVYARR